MYTSCILRCYFDDPASQIPFGVIVHRWCLIYRVKAAFPGSELRCTLNYLVASPGPGFQVELETRFAAHQKPWGWVIDLTLTHLKMSELEQQFSSKTTLGNRTPVYSCFSAIHSKKGGNYSLRNNQMEVGWGKTSSKDWAGWDPIGGRTNGVCEVYQPSPASVPPKDSSIFRAVTEYLLPATAPLEDQLQRPMKYNLLWTR